MSILKTLKDKCFSIRAYTVYRSAPSDNTKSEAIDRYTFRSLSIDDLDRCALSHQKNRLEGFKENLAGGHTCFGHVHEKTNEIISYFWHTQAQNKAPFDYGRVLEVPKDSAYIWNCRVSSDHTGQGFYQNGLRTFKSLHSAQTLWMISEEDNAASHNGIIKAGFEVVSDYTLMKIGRAIFEKRDGQIRRASGVIKLSEFFDNSG